MNKHEELKKKYKSLSTDELIELFDSDELTDESKEILRSELADRSIVCKNTRIICPHCKKRYKIPQTTKIDETKEIVCSNCYKSFNLIKNIEVCKNLPPEEETYNKVKASDFRVKGEGLTLFSSLLLAIFLLIVLPLQYIIPFHFFIIFILLILSSVFIIKGSSGFLMGLYNIL